MYDYFLGGTDNFEADRIAAALNARQLDAPLVLREHTQVTRFVVQLSKWRPRSAAESAAPAALWGGVAGRPPR